MTVAIYLRVSTEEQRERQTIATQRDFAERFCDLHQINISGFYQDDGVSGLVTMDERPEGKRLLEDARVKKFDTVMVYKLDRLGRNARLILNSVDDLEKLGLQVKSMTEPFDTSTPAGRFMLTILAATAALERDTIVERSINGTNRLAREGAWLGGIVPFGYKVEGKDREARLLVSDDLLTGLTMSEADVIRLIYRKAAEEHKSCIAIAETLNQLGVPPSYTKDGRQLLRGKRKETTAGIWRPSRIRNIIVNPTYRGLHRYGKRSQKQREIIERPVPAIVSVETWERAQQTLRENMLFSKRNTKRSYLLRGLIKCGLCGLTYVGIPSKEKTYYRCNGKHMGRSLYALEGKRCPSKDLSSTIEDTIWADIENFLRNPGQILEQLSQRVQEQAGASRQVEGEIALLQVALLSKKKERDLVIGLFRKGRISVGDLDTQLDQIDREETQLNQQIAELSHQSKTTETVSLQLSSVENLLLELNQALDQPFTWEMKRKLVETLVKEIRVDTVQEDAKKYAQVTVGYWFGGNSSPVLSTTNYRDMDSSHRSE
jgi:site-specific DNA recombinase